MTPRFVIAIPVYNHPQTVTQVAAECLRITDLPILIVDDGSTIPVEELFQKEKTTPSPRLHFQRHAMNRGKGTALQTAFRWALGHGYTHIITIDADGQHFPEDIPRMMKRSLENPWALILGDREMNAANIPPSSQFGKKFSNFWIQFETQQTVGDSQSGFRIYPLFHVQNLNFFSSHYDFEVEVLTRLLWQGVKVENVKVRVDYQPGGKARITHFDKWRDNLRISILNSMLVTIALLRNTHNRFLNALALGLGVFVGTTPFYGFHTLIIILIALAARLNVILLWIGTHISLPPLIPFLIIGTKWVYTSIYQSQIEITDYRQLLQLGSHWIYSSLILGLGLGASTTLIAYGLQSQKTSGDSKKKTSDRWSKKSYAHPGIWFVGKLMEFGGIRVAYLFLYLIIPFYFLNLRVRRASNEYWKTVRPSLSFWPRQRMIFKQLLIFAQNLVDRAYQRTSSRFSLQLNKDESLDSFYDLMEHSANRPCILVSTHFGGWELAMTAFNKIATKRRMLVIMYQAGHGQNHASTEQTTRDNFEIMYFNEANFSILKIKEYLSRGDVVGLMADRPVGRSFELIPFFNKIAALDSTAFRLAEMLDTELFYLFCIKEGILTYRLSALRSTFRSSKTSVATLPPEQEDLVQEWQSQRQKNLIGHMEEYSRLLQEQVEKSPEQWMNFFPFFSTEPKTS